MSDWEEEGEEVGAEAEAGQDHEHTFERRGSVQGLGEMIGCISLFYICMYILLSTQYLFASASFELACTSMRTNNGGEPSNSSDS